MANPQPSSGGLGPFTQVAIAVGCRGLALRVALRLLFGVGLADAAFPDLNLVVLVLTLRWLDRSPPGSAERRWARLASWAASSSLSAVAAWSLFGTPSWQAVVWAIAALVVLLIWLVLQELYEV